MISIQKELKIKYAKLLIGILHKIFTLDYWDTWKKNYLTYPKFLNCN